MRGQANFSGQCGQGWGRAACENVQSVGVEGLLPQLINVCMHVCLYAHARVCVCVYGGGQACGGGVRTGLQAWGRCTHALSPGIRVHWPLAPLGKPAWRGGVI